MSVSIVMPKLGDVMEVGTVAHWLKEQGQWVHKGEPLFEVETEKIAFVIESIGEGYLRQAVPERAEVPIGGQVAQLVTQEEMAAPTEPETAAMAVRETQSTTEVRTDPDAVLKSGAEEATRTEAVVGLHAKEVIPLRGLRKVIAERMFQSLQAMAQLTIMQEVDMTKAIRLRQQWGKDWGFLASYTDIIVKAVGEVIRHHPMINSSLLNGKIHVWSEINIAIAVDIPEGLITPVVHDVAGKSLRQIAQETRELAERARSGTLAMRMMSGGTFTVTSLGMLDVEMFTPIVNPPQVAVLGVGRISERPVVLGGAIVPRSMMYLSLSFDHRVVDGAPAARFLRDLKELLEAPEKLEGER